MDTSKSLNIPLHIRKLSLVVTEICNLNCSYCYARLSGRWTSGIIMTSSTIDKIIEKVIKKVYACDFIQLFGGEPSLNLDMIDYLINRVNKLHDQGVINKKPRFGIVTNGVFRDKEKVYNVIRKNSIEATISIDGPAIINDKLRTKKNGASVYYEIIQTIDYLNKSDVNITLEFVYTTQHIIIGFSIIDCLEFAERLGVKKVIFQPAYPPADHSLNPLSSTTINKYLEYNMQAVDWWFNQLLRDEIPIDIYFKDLLKMMLNGRSSLLSSGCPAGCSDFSIGPDGSIYPCQLLFGNKRFLLGNIFQNDFILEPKRINEIHDEFEPCKNCFARHWCQPCAALNDFFGNIAQPPENECLVRKAVILRIAQWVQRELKFPDNNISSLLQKEITKL